MAFCNRHFHGGQASRLHTNHTHSRIGFLHGAGDSRNQPAASDWSNYRFDVRDLLQNLQPHSSLSGDHDFIVEGMNKRHTELLASAHSLCATTAVPRGSSARDRARCASR